MGYILLRCFSVTCAVFHQLQVRQTPVNPVKIPFSNRANIQIKTDLLQKEIAARIYGILSFLSVIPELRTVLSCLVNGHYSTMHAH